MFNESVVLFVTVVSLFFEVFEGCEPPLVVVTLKFFSGDFTYADCFSWDAYEISRKAFPYLISGPCSFYFG